MLCYIIAIGVKVTPEQTMPNCQLRVFLCHSSGDKPAVRDLYRRLKADGFAPWLDEEELLPGQDWQQEIPAAVRACDVVVICLSQKSVTKEGYLQREIREALYVAEENPEGTIFVIPVKLEEVEVPKRLAQWQWANLFQEGGYRRLVRALEVRASTIGATVAPHETTGWEEAQRKTREAEEARRKAETERVAAENAEAERARREKAERERLVAEKAEAERAAKEKEQQEARARVEADQKRLAHEKAETERLAAAAEQAVREKAEQERRGGRENRSRDAAEATQQGDARRHCRGCAHLYHCWGLVFLVVGQSASAENTGEVESATDGDRAARPHRRSSKREPQRRVEIRVDSRGNFHDGLLAGGQRVRR